MGTCWRSTPARTRGRPLRSRCSSRLGPRRPPGPARVPARSTPASPEGDFPVRVWRSPAEVPADLGRTVVTVGNFDGVHLGHQRVVRRARQRADELGAEAVVAVTFDPHPMAVLRPEQAPQVLTSVERRAELLAEVGVDALLVVPFDRDLASWSPERF